MAMKSGWSFPRPTNGSGYESGYAKGGHVKPKAMAPARHKPAGMRAAKPSAPPMAPPPMPAAPPPMPMGGDQAPPVGMKNGGRVVHHHHHFARGGKEGDEAQDRAMITKAIHEHEQHDHKGEPMTKLQFAEGGHVQHIHHVHDGYAAGGKFIQKAIKKPGQLHRDLGVPQGKKIPEKKIEAAAKRPGKVGERARFAETLKGLRKK